jgi:hypothetical protein
MGNTLKITLPIELYTLLLNLLALEIGLLQGITPVQEVFCPIFVKEKGTRT